jgi:carbonic anhydrase
MLSEGSQMLKLLPGLSQFKSEVHSANEKFFERLASGQTPDAIFISCSDSRVVPSLITQTAPGTLFVIRNAGNIVPAYDPDGDSPGEEATIEYAINHLNVKEIVVCGHSGCGAMQGLLQMDKLESMPAVKKWLKHTQRTVEILARDYCDLDWECKISAAIQVNVLVQLENLRTLPCIAKRVMKREIELHGWVYDIESGEVFIFDPIDEEFKAPVKVRDGYELNSSKTYSNK